jgi:hypothetical protein
VEEDSSCAVNDYFYIVVNGNVPFLSRQERNITAASFTTRYTLLCIKEREAIASCTCQVKVDTKKA